MDEESHRMTRSRTQTAACPVCREERPIREIVHHDLVHSPLVDQIHRERPDWSGEGLICLACLNGFRARYVEEALRAQIGELSKLDEEVVQSLKEQEVVTENLNAGLDAALTPGERIADRVAEFGGSWRFILSFGFVLLVWIAVNSTVLLMRPFDAYPYILLNLVLSCLAALQAPIIMMSQNRQEARDRLRAEHDYRVNLKAELEIRHLHWKMDQLLTHQWRRLLEIQQIQTELMEELVHKPRRDRGGNPR
jgi:uncharacterized membrane protein